MENLIFFANGPHNEILQPLLGRNTEKKSQNQSPHIITEHPIVKKTHRALNFAPKQWKF